MNSFSLIRTNTKLTTNIKIVVTSKYELFLESYDSTPDLSMDRFKRFRFNKNNFYDELVPFFFKNIPTSTAFSVKYSNDSDKMYNEFENQYDDIYLAGCNIVEDTDYEEEFECIAPLHIDRYNLPSDFVIFRIDGPGIIDLNSSNFKGEILDKLKCVTIFDLSKNTQIGEFLDRNYRKNDSFPTTPLELDFRKSEFSKWNGIEYESGGYSEKSLFLEDWLEKEKTFFDFDRFITDGYENNKVVYPNILNFKFLFDDTPGDKSKLNKWSINRYLGFFLDSMDMVKKITLYSPYILESNIVINSNNIFLNQTGNKIKPIVKDWDDYMTYYVEYNGDFYIIERFIEIGETEFTYKIISDINLSGKESLLNKNIITINDDNIIEYNTDFNSSIFDIDGYDKADVWLIKIDTKFHVLKKINNKIFIQSDYGFRLNNNKLEYFINENDPSYTTTVDLNNISDILEPQGAPIFRLNFTEIKDFDTSIINTDWSKYEYELEDVISNSDEPKLYRTNISDKSNPKQFDEFIYDNRLVNIPVTSEYICNSEIFETDNNKTLSDIWRKNSVSLKWGYMNSISNSDYLYKANNSLIGDDFNRTTNVFKTIPNRFERNLDYFYTINPDSNQYINHSLHITDYINDYTGINSLFRFEIDKYMNIGTVSVSEVYIGDYFDYLFTKKEAFKNGEIIKNSKKYSLFNYGDNVVTNSTLLRGIKFNIYKVSNLLFKGDNSIDKISIEPTSNMDNYKFSVLLSENKEKLLKTGIINSSNSLEWAIIKEWELGTTYQIGDLVSYLDMIFEANSVSMIENSNDNPLISNDWILPLFINDIPLWNNLLTSPPNNTYIYRYGEYYYYDASATNTISFWLPTTSYNVNDTTIYKGVIYRAKQANINKLPSYNNDTINDIYWEKHPTLKFNNSDVTWNIVEQYNPILTYGLNEFTVYNDSLYEKTTVSTIEDKPGTSTDWTFIHSIVPDTNRIYNNTKLDNNLIFMNGAYYLCKSNINNDTLDSGIDIYINKKWKNILINIYVNDNTLPKLSNVKRDEIYDSIYSNLTAKNFIETINDFDNRYGFSDYIRYIIIDEDNSYNIYSFNDNLNSLPYIIEAQGPDKLNIRTNSLNIKGVDVNRNLYKVNSVLKDNNISSIRRLNHYNNDKLGVDIKNTREDIKILNNISGTRNINFLPIYRYSGDYMPIFKSIELFENVNSVNNTDLIGNYKFDTSLTKFGIMTERIFSKVNIDGDVLKFKDIDNVNSIYPVIDEFGYNYTDHFIFKSTWDTKYYKSIK